MRVYYACMYICMYKCAVTRDPEILFLVKIYFLSRRENFRRQKRDWFHYETDSYVDVHLDYLEIRFPNIASFIMKHKIFL